MQDVIEDGVLFGRTGVRGGCLWVISWRGKWAVMGAHNSFNGNVNLEILASELEREVDDLTIEQIMDEAMDKVVKYCDRMASDEAFNA